VVLLHWRHNDIHKCGDHADAQQARFHSRHNRLKGDRAGGAIHAMVAVIPRLEKQGMVSRALSLATVTLLIGSLTAGVARAQNLDAGKSPSQIFSGTCSACHKSPRGLLKTTPASSLPGFLRQHYTTGTDMASVLASYLISNGAADPRYQTKDQKRDARQDRRQEGRPDQPERVGRRQPSAAPAQEAARPDDVVRPQAEGARQGREGRRYGRSRAAPDAAQPADDEAPVQAATDSKPVGRQKHGRRGRSAPQEMPRTEQMGPGGAAKGEDPSKTETSPTDSAGPAPVRVDPDSVKSEPSGTGGFTIDGERPRSEATKPAGERARESRGDDGPGENVVTESNAIRSDPVITSAPPASAAASESSSSSPATTATIPPPVTATVPTAPAGSPAPPISR
jgi:hypothetical protein